MNNFDKNFIDKSNIAVKDVEKYLLKMDEERQKTEKGKSFTKSQEDVILHIGNVIESAGAGCGKTSVLVEKICQFIRVGIFNIDEVIIMTFTNNATNEMKSRIKKRLNELAQEETDTEYKNNLNKAILSINSANVSTIDSLCKKIVNTNFEKLEDIPINNRIADETELKVLMYQVFDEVIEKNIKEEKFSKFFKSYFNKSEDNIKDNLLYEGLKFVYNFAWPEDFFTPKDDYTDLEKEYNELLKECYIGFENKKKEKGVIAISDLSHLALKILYKNVDGVHSFSDVSLNMQNTIKYLFVDEYQDTSFIQEELIKAINGNFEKVCTFLVGDLKQSIYRFRNSRVEFFKNKIDEDKRKELGYEDIDIIKTNDNFRCDPHIINFVNDFFGKIMKKNIGGIDYIKDHALIVPEVNKENNDEKNKVEINVFHNHGKKGATDIIKANKSLEAEFVAKRIIDLVNIDKYSYNDIVILHRGPSGIVKEFEKAFRKHGIPLTYEKKSGFYDSYEIRLLMAFLCIIDNPMQDIYLTSVINTGIFKVTLDELSILKVLKHKDDTYYTYIKRLLWAYKFDKDNSINIDDLNLEDKEKNAKNIINDYKVAYGKIFKGQNDNTLVNKLDYFINVLNDLIEKSRYKSAADIVEEIFNKVNLIEYVCGLDNHETGKENLLYFLELARSVNSTAYRDVYNFNVYLDSLVKKKADLGEADIPSDEPKVRIISIHKSKGMEYPVVILPLMTTRLNISKYNNLDKDVYFTYDKGLSLNEIDIDNRMIKITDKRKNIVYNERKEIIDEYIRLLYVATTRACKKLICSLSFDSSNAELEREKDKGEKDVSITNKKLYGDLVYFNEGGALISNFGKLLFAYLNTNDSLVKDDSINISYADRSYTNNDIILNISSAKKITEYIENKVNNVNNLLNVNTSDEYFKDENYIINNNIKPKYSVSEIKHSKDSEFDFNFYNKLKNMNEDNDQDFKEILSGSALGTLYHNFMSIYNFDDNYENTLSKLHNSEKSFDKNLFIDKIDKFLNTDIAKEIKKAYDNNLLFREQRFMKNFDTKEVLKKMGMEDLEYINDDDKVIVQGVIDCFYINDNNEIVLIDYKTDFLNREISDDKVKKELSDMYEVQLSLYAESLKKITGKNISKKYIYSFKIDDFIEIN